MKDVYTLADLADETLLNPAGEPPARLAVIGNPVAHSKSPQLHQPALTALGIAARYIRLKLEVGELKAALPRMGELGFYGANVTVPYKFEALANCTIVDPSAEALGSVNTLVFQEKNEILGYNTDGPGFARAIEDVFSKKLSELKVMIVGAGGGAGQALATQCVLEECQKLVLVNRSIDKIQALATRFTTSFGGKVPSISCLALDSNQLVTEAHDCDLIIQTSSLGLKPSDPSPIPADCFQKNHLAYDTIYEPAQTLFLKEAQAVGAQTANGLSLLKHQGAISFQHWFPSHDPLPYMSF